MTKRDQLKSSGAADSDARNSSPAPVTGSLPAGESDPSVTLDCGAGEAKRGRGRPRILGPRPWDSMASARAHGTAIGAARQRQGNDKA